MAILEDGTRKLAGRANDGDDLSCRRQRDSGEMKSEYEQWNLLET